MRHRLLRLLLLPWIGFMIAGSEALAAKPPRAPQPRKISDHPLFSWEYAGPYPDRDGLQQEVLRHVDRPVLCTTFAAYARMSNASAAWMGRNYDFNQHPALLLVTRPSHGYASVSMVDLGFLGYADALQVESDPGRLRYAPYAPTDGMNEHGLAAAVMYMPDTQAGYDPEKPTLYSLEAVRVMLDHARTTEEAVHLLAAHNLAFPGLPVHYLIADATGCSAVVEVVAGKMEVMKNQGPWQVATNFKLHEAGPGLEARRVFYHTHQFVQDDPGDSYLRFFRTETSLKAIQDQLTLEKVMGILRSVAVTMPATGVNQGWISVPGQATWRQGRFGTQWSAAYNLAQRTLALVLASDYSRYWSFSFPSMRVNARNNPPK